ncbi:MAG TPA: hypothetical protein VJB88_00765, partial [Vicinamibacteria bacterium]|nr:hypothetical protein [Vicinamibacteria bacterium]
MTLGDFRWVVLVMLALGLASSGAAAEISGKVGILEGNDAPLAAVRDVVVYVDGIQGPVTPSAEPGVHNIVMENKTFSPHLQVIPKGEE